MKSEAHMKIHWQSETDYTLFTVPTVTAESVITVGIGQSSRSKMGFLDVWDRSTGQRQWSFSGEAGMGISGGIRVHPVIMNNLICFATRSGNILCLDLRSGIIQWEVQMGGKGVIVPTVLDNQIIFADQKGELTALDLQSGQHRWTFQTGSAIHATPMVENNYIVSGNRDGHIQAITTEGTLLWKFDLSPAQPTKIALADKHVVFFDAVSGNIRIALVTQGGNTWHINEVRHFPLESRLDVRPVLAANLAYFTGKGEDKITCVSTDTGEPQWVATTGNLPFTPVVEGNQLIVASRDQTISAFNLQTGEQQWRVDTQIPLDSEPAVFDGVLYIVGRDRTVYAIEIEMGATD